MLQVEQHTKITMSPLHAKIVAKLFSDYVEVYEKQFGEINVPMAMPENKQ